ncbi:MAG: hypothetical protein CMM46_04315 [Rhodospirillaceae bacterium]|nr:hypothetical protein [Rhodospirillaceae bacterium]|tara:strand:+ start:6332 stop:6652 length:321 start_codon:yes stop_codon:yes gene_type:complete
MQSLGVVGRLFPEILNGSKTSTTRWRELRIEPRRMTCICDDDPSSTVVVWITRRTDFPLRDAAALVDHEDDWPNHVMLAGMREHYRDITLDDTTQIVEHLPPDQTK